MTMSFPATYIIGLIMSIWQKKNFGKQPTLSVIRGFGGLKMANGSKIMSGVVFPLMVLFIWCRPNSKNSMKSENGQKKSNLKIAIIGFGSIGQRHYKNLLALGYKNIFVYDVDESKIGGGVKTLAGLSEKKLRDFDIAFICNPTSEHIKTALLCTRAGCHLFIEKPLSHNLSGIADLAKICREKKLIVL